ncbi:MAG: DUF4381 domain-containing protein [Desulfuromonas sp.]|nr:DUF4381 domain-containing protein [Desulfuromonas sp.]
MTPAASPPASMTNNPGAQLVLRDIHLPQPVSWWPLAPGWWLLLALGVIILIASLFAWRRYKQRRYRRIALRQLSMMENNLRTDNDQQLLLQELSKLLRHMAVLHYPAQQCAGLCAEKWLSFLDSTLPTKQQQHHPFSSGVGRCLASAPYRAPVSTQKSSPQELVSADTAADTSCHDQMLDDSLALLQLSRRWVQNLPLPPHSRRSA